MNHVTVVLMCFASVVAVSFVVACRNYLARVAKEKADTELTQTVA
jgi:hypothetical protein